MSLKQLLSDVFGSGQKPPTPADGSTAAQPPAPQPSAQPAPDPRAGAGAAGNPWYEQGRGGTQPLNLEHPQYPAQQYPAQQYPAQQYPAEPHPAQQYPAQQYPAQQYPAQQYPAQQYPAEPHPAPEWTAPAPAIPAPERRPQELAAPIVGLAAAALFLVLALVIVGSSVASAKQRLLAPDSDARPAVAIAQQAEVAYCTKDFKQVLERVLHSCGLAAQTERRGCKPADIRTFAAINDQDFNALFHPLRERGGVLLFEEGRDELDSTSKKLLEERWFDRKGARYFFVVARASKTGTADRNRALSHRRANSVFFHLKEISGESEQELSQKVGLLWLGNEYAQLSEDYCSWPRSRGEEKCSEEAINRSAFVSWVDCRL